MFFPNTKTIFYQKLLLVNLIVINKDTIYFVNLQWSDIGEIVQVSDHHFDASSWVEQFCVECDIYDWLKNRMHIWTSDYRGLAS